MEELSQIEERNPGLVGAAMATEIEVTTIKVDELMRGLKELRKGLTRKKVALL